MNYRIDIGNVRGIRGEKGQKGERGKTPTYDEIKYETLNGEYITIVTDTSIVQSPYYLDATNRLCDSEGHLIDENGNVTNIIGVPFDVSEYGYLYKPLWVDERGRYTNSKGELLDGNFNVQYVETSFIQDILDYLFMDEKKWNELVTDIYPHVTDELVSADPNDERFKAFFDEIEGDIKYYICANNPRTNIYLQNNKVVNTCKYVDENGSIVIGSDNKYVPVPLEKNTLYLYNPSGVIDNDIMHYDIYVCTKANTVPKKLVSAADFIVNYNIIDDVLIEVKDNLITEENDVFLKTLLRGSGRVYTVEEVDTLFMNNLINKLGVGNGIAQLNGNGKVPSSQLPAYIDDVVEGTMNNNVTTFTPSDNDYIDSVKQTGKIYVDVNTKKTYRWSGSNYVLISNPIIVDDGSTSAYSSTKGTALETKIGNSTLTTTDKTITGAINELDAHTHGSLNNNGKINSDITNVNKIVVTDSSNNIKTISLLPSDKIDSQFSTINASNVINSVAYPNLSTTANATQAEINSAINMIIGNAIAFINQ